MGYTIDIRWFTKFVHGAWAQPSLTRNDWQARLHDPATEGVTAGRKRYNDYRQLLSDLNLWNSATNRPLGTLEAACSACNIPLPQPKMSAGGLGGRAGGRGGAESGQNLLIGQGGGG